MNIFPPQTSGLKVEKVNDAIHLPLESGYGESEYTNAENILIQLSTNDKQEMRVSCPSCEQRTAS